MKPTTHLIEIIEFNSRFRADFRDLNLEWIQNYFKVESSDVYELNNPEEAIINKGGKIFFAQEENRMVGTFALARHNETTFELGKMSVKPCHRGKGIGKLLMAKAISYSTEVGVNRITLHSNTQLCAALNLYIGYGFRVIPNNDFHRQRANIKMELKLNG